jgi:hypothetical protein
MHSVNSAINISSITECHDLLLGIMKKEFSVKEKQGEKKW